MRITFVLATLSGGGIQRATMRLISELQQGGKDVTLVTLNGDGPLRKMIPEGCKHIDLEVRRVRSAFMPLWHCLSDVNSDVVISSQTHLNALLIILRLFSKRPRTLIVREHVVFEAGVLSSASVVERLRPLLIRIFYRFADSVIVVSKDAERSINKFWHERSKIQVIPNGLDIDAIRELASEPIEHSWLNSSKTRVVIGVGRLAPQKNFILLLEAFKRLEHIQDLRLVLIGAGEDHPKLQAHAESLGILHRVGFLGFVDNPYAYMARANVFVLSSLWEGFPNVVLEALACGLPVVSTNCPGSPKEFLDGHAFASFVPIEAPESMADAILVQLSRSLSNSDLETALDQFRISSVAMQYENLLESLQ